MLLLFFLFGLLRSVQVGDWCIAEGCRSGKKLRVQFIVCSDKKCVMLRHHKVVQEDLKKFSDCSLRVVNNGGQDVADRAIVRIGEHGVCHSAEAFCLECLLNLEPGEWLQPASAVKVNQLDQKATEKVLGMLRDDYVKSVKSLLSSRHLLRHTSNFFELAGKMTLYAGVACSTLATAVPLVGEYLQESRYLSFISTGLFATHVMLIGCARCSSKEEKEREQLLKDHADMVGFKIKTLANDVNDEMDEVAAAGVGSQRIKTPERSNVGPDNDHSPVSDPSATNITPDLLDRPEHRVPVAEGRKWTDRSSPFDQLAISSELGFAGRADFSQ